MSNEPKHIDLCVNPNGLGDVLSKLLDNLGVETNPVKTKLISVSCDGGAQLVY